MSNPFDDLVGKAKKIQEEMQEKVKKIQDGLLNTQVTGESGAGLVQVVMNGRHDVIRVSFDNSLMKEDKIILEDLVAAAINDAVRKVDVANKEKLASVAPGINMNFPDGFKPF